jgi:hypothetical protein
MKVLLVEDENNLALLPMVPGTASGVIDCNVDSSQNTTVTTISAFTQVISPSSSPGDLMSIRYRKHLILPTINQDEVTGAWFGSVHIQYTEKLKFHNVLIQVRGIFWTSAEAEKQVIKEAKEWIDSRLRSGHGK